MTEKCDKLLSQLDICATFVYHPRSAGAHHPIGFQTGPNDFIGGPRVSLSVITVGREWNESRRTFVDLSPRMLQKPVFLNSTLTFASSYLTTRNPTYFAPLTETTNQPDPRRIDLKKTFVSPSGKDFFTLAEFLLALADFETLFARSVLIDFGWVGKADRYLHLFNRSCIGDDVLVPVWGQQPAPKQP